MKHALIWGAAGGIGKALTKKLIDENYTVVTVSRHPADLKKLTPHSIATDVTNPSQVRAAAHQIRAISGTIDLFVYTAGDITSNKTTDISFIEWDRILNANLTGAFLTAQASLPILTPEAKLIFLGAVHERLRLPGLGAYAAAKAGLEAFAESLHKETRRDVIVVRPAAVDTNFWSKVPFSRPKNALEPDAVATSIFQALYEKSDNFLLDL